MANKIEKRTIFKESSILDALQKMDANEIKLLFVFDENNRFLGLLSLGDIQRAILNKINMSSEVSTIMREKFYVAYVDTEKSEIEQTMLEQRIECVPILNHNNELVNVYFWEEIFQKEDIEQRTLHVPVVIMAGGMGSRLQPLTNVIPKALVPIGKKPITEIIIDSFYKIGITEFYLSVYYKANMLEQYFNEIKPPYNMHYFQEDKPLGTGGSLFLLKNKIKSTFFVTNCDILIDQNYLEIYDYHKNSNNLITIVAALKHYDIPYGTIETGKNGELISMQEKPSLTFMINSGMYILEPSVLDEIPDNEFLHITDLIEKVKDKGGKVGVFPISEKSWMDIGVWEEYHQTLNHYESKFNK